jgi:GDPmannose 4,6-dehydratase
VRLLEAVEEHAPNAAVFVAGSMDMFGNVEGGYNDDSIPAGWWSEKSGEDEIYHRNERSPAEPVSPYGASKLFVANMVRIYREQGLKVCCGIMGPHESPRRPERFVTRKITMAAARISLDLQSVLQLGNTSAVRCWFHAKDAVRAMRLMVEKLDKARTEYVRGEAFDYIVGSPNAHTVTKFAATAFEVVGLDWRKHVVIDESLVRASDVHAMRCDPSAIKYDLGWEPTISFEELVTEMVLNDIEIAKGELSK